MSVGKMVENMMAHDGADRMDKVYYYQYLFGSEFEDGLKKCLLLGGTTDMFIEQYEKMEVGL